MRTNVMDLVAEPYPDLRIAAFQTVFPSPLSELSTPPAILALLSPDATAPLRLDDKVRRAVRDLLRHRGYKPTGRGKPASEYLVRAASEGALLPINLAVDACNAVSLHSSLPISVVDLDLAKPPFRIAVASAGARYVFNASGQEIDLAGLLCLFDGQGPCANAVRDSQRTKTTASTRRTLSIIWAPAEFEDRLRQAEQWYRELLSQGKAIIEPVNQAKSSGKSD